MNAFRKCMSRSKQFFMRSASKCLTWREQILLDGDTCYTDLAAALLGNDIHKPFVISGQSAEKLDLMDDMLRTIKHSMIDFVVWSECTPDPTVALVEKALADYKDNECDAIIAFGGGSAIDCAKAVCARLAKPNKSLQQMKGVNKVGKKSILLVAVPTTSGSGSECSIASVITDEDTHEKFALDDLNLVPDYAVLDPKLLVSLPPHTTATTGMDALTHAVEAYIGKSNTDFTSDKAERAVKLIFDNLPKAFADGGDLEARRNMQLGAYYAGEAFTRAYVGYTHALAHQLGGMYHTAHGLANAVLLPHILRSYGNACENRLAALAKIISLSGQDEHELAQAFIAKICELNKLFDLPEKLDCIRECDLDLMAERADKEANPLYPVPKLLDKAELKQIYKQIM